MRSLFAIYLVANSVAYARTPAVEPSLPYTVLPSDVLIVIASELLREPKAWGEVARFNGMRNPNRINPGQVIRFPLRLLKSTSLPARVLSASGDVSVAAGSAIAEGQQVRVGANSSAVIQLGDGSRVKLLPSSLSEVASNRNYAMRDPGASISTNWFSGAMRVVQGGLEVLAAKTDRRAEPLRVQLPTAVVGVRGTVFRAAHGEGAGAFSRTEVLEGTVQADNPAQGSGVALGAGFGAVVNPAQREVKIASLLPAPSFLPGGGKMVAFEPVRGASKYRLQVSRDPQFDGIVRELVLSHPKAELDVVDGEYYLRARAIDADGLEGKDAAIKRPLVTVAAPEPAPLPFAAPGEAARVGMMSAENGEFRFVLPADLTLSDARFVIARDRSMVPVLVQGNVEAGAATVGKLPAGVYFVRLSSTTGVTRSSTYRFEVHPNLGITVFTVMGALTPAD